MHFYILFSLYVFVSIFNFSECAPWNWDSVAIGGGGYVTGLLVHPNEAEVLYARCDVGGVYRFDFDILSWVPLLDMFGPDQKNFYGGDSFAIDPSNPDILYVAAGMYDYWGPGDVLKSTDRGLTWQFTNLNLVMGANQDVRWAGERLMVNPYNTEEVYYGSRNDGLWIKNGTSDWKAIISLPSNGTIGSGVVFILFDIKNVIYAGIFGEGVYMSPDGGHSWTFMENSPMLVIRALITVPGSLLTVTENGVFKYSGGQWTDISPVSNLGYGSVTVHPSNPDIIIVGERAGSEMLGVYRTMNGGKSWENLTPNATIIHDVPWWPNNFFAAATSSIVMDPFTIGRAYLATWFGVYFCDDILNITTTWYTKEKGHEEVFSIILHAPSNGGVYSGTADVTGFKITDFQVYPLAFNNNSEFHTQDTTSIDSAENNPNVVVRVGTNNSPPLNGGGGFSLDNGQSWKKFPTMPVDNNYAVGGAISISSDASTLVWWPFQNHIYYSKDMGSTWILSKGGPFNNNSCCHQSVGIDAAYSVNLCSDKVNSSVFYTFDSLTGTIATSKDGGQSFNNESTLSSYDPTFPNVILQSAPGIEGELWVSLGNRGLWRSSDYGKSFSQIKQIERSLLFAFGKEAPSNNVPSLYVLGAIDNVQSVFASTDLGVTWEDIGSKSYGLGDNPWSMAADRSTYGRVYVGTLGRGVYIANSLN